MQTLCHLDIIITLRESALKKDFKQVTDYLRNNLRKDDIIAHTHQSSGIPIWYYFHCHDPVDSYYFVLYPKADKYWQKEVLLWEKEVPLWEKGQRDGKIRSSVIDLTQDQDIKKYNFKRIWLISSSWFRTGELEPNSLAIKELMEKNYRKSESREFDGLLVELYEN